MRKKQNKKSKIYSFKSFFIKNNIRVWLTIFIIGLILFPFLFKVYKNNLYNRLELDSDILSKSVSLSLYNLDFGTLKKILESYIEKKEIYKIELFDEFNNKIKIEKKTNEKIKLLKINKDVLKDNFKIGKIYIYYSLSSYLKQFYLYYFIIYLIFFSGSFIYFLDFKKLIEKYFEVPVNNLINALDSITKKHYNQKIDYNNYYLYETIEIAKKFNLMSDKIKETIDKLNKNKNQLNISISNFENIINNIPDAIFIHSMDNKLLFVNEKAIELYGYNEDDLKKQSILNRSSDEYSIQDVKEKFELAKFYKQGVQFEWNARKKNGEIFPVIVRIKYIKYEGIDAILSVVTDKSNLKKIEESLVEIEQKYKNLFNNIPVGVFYFNKNGQITLYNPGIIKVFNLLLDENKNVDLQIEKILNENKVKEKILALIKDNEEKRVFETEYKKRNIELYAKFILSSIKDKNGNIVGGVGIVNDITNDKKLEKEYLKASKLESLGILAGGIAHDFNNIFAGIIGNITLAKYLIPDDPELKEVLQDIEEISLKAKTLTNQILTFARGSTPVKKIIDIKELMNKIIDIVFAGTKIKIEKRFEKDLYKIKADSEQLHNAFYNILCNAKEAVERDKGVITIELNNFIIKEKEKIKNSVNKQNEIKNKIELDLEPGRYIKITISDNGSGISKSELQKIFDPYYTTKPKGKGIGLSVSYSIINKHGGYIFCDSEIDKGTTFFIYLPVYNVFDEKVFQGDKYEVHDSLKEFKLKGKVLIMDDEVVIRKTLKKMFNLMGVKTYIANEGTEAITLYKKLLKNKEKIDLVILDLTVPGGLGGKEVIKEFKKINPEIKAIISSGYSNNDIMGNYKKYGFVDVIKKPYTINELYKKVKPFLMN